MSCIADMPAILLKAVEESQRRTGGVVVPEKLKTETEIAEGMDALASGSLGLGPSTELTARSAVVCWLRLAKAR